MLSLSDLRVSYRTRRGVEEAVRGVSLDVAAGEVVALVGESGSGKSTTGQAVLGLLPAGGVREAGRIVFDGTDLTRVDARRLRSLRGREIALVPQDPTVSLNPVRRVGHQVAEALLIHRLADRAEAAERAVALLERAGVPEPAVRARQFPHQLSGGLRQRVLIAVALAAGPRLLIADEPTSALDVTVQRQVLDHLETLTRSSGTAVLLITHDLGVAADRARRIAVMSGGVIVEAGPTERVLGAPRHPYTRALLRAAPSLDGARAVRGAGPREPGRPPLARGEELVKEFPGPRGAPAHRAVAGVSLQVRAGETLALVGESGSGKSTTARMLVRLTDATSGRVFFDGEDITRLGGARLRRLRRRVQIVQQNPYASLNPRFSVAEVIGEPLRACGVGPRRVRWARAAELLERVGLPAGTLHRRPGELSGGQRQRVAIARALAPEPELVVCDEPVSALDVTTQAQILELLTTLQDELGVGYLFISHDLAVVRRIAHRVAVMRRGEVVEEGDVERIFTSPGHDYTRELLDAIPGSRTRAVPPAGPDAAPGGRDGPWEVTTA
ncbi:ABC transporter ATP-binding protein [Streptomyces sedi]|uniref:ABC transporter ATP-binding protein n=1 Tax=Streptomyces sedi TaxID=555059 RepID=A0A5C4V2H2_9ACTN|nr:ABC transporter ATP-binding protein [Streptomyces sedi]